MKRFLMLAVLLALLVAGVASAQAPSVLYRENVRWRSAVASAVGGLVDSDNTVTFDGSSLSDTTNSINLSCVSPRTGSVIAADSTLFIRFVLERVSGTTGGWVAAPNVVFQSLTTPSTLGLAGVAASATTARLSAHAGAPDTTHSIQYSWAVAHVAVGNPSWVRFILASTTIKGTYRGYVEYLTACPGRLP